MLFRRHKISNLKIKIWDIIHELQKQAPGQSPEAVAQVDHLYYTFNELTGRDPQIEYDNKQVVNFYKLSYKLVDFISENYKKDKHFACLHIVVNWLSTYLWTQAYLGRGRIDESILNGVSDMFDETRDKLDDYVNKLVLFEKINTDVQAAIKRADSVALQSLKYQYDNYDRLCKGYQYDINAKEEAFLAQFQVGALNADRVKANFNYTDEVTEATRKEFNKIEDAARSHYRFVRNAVDQMIIESQAEAVNQGTDKEVQVVEETVSKEQNLQEHTKELLEAEHPDIIAVYANLRLALDTYLKYEKGIDLNLSEGFYDKVTDTKYEYEKKYSSKKTFIKLFGETNGLYVDELWSTASDLLHGGTEHLTLDLDPKAVNSLKAKAYGYAAFLDGIIDMHNINYLEGTKMLYQRRKEFLKWYKEKYAIESYVVDANRTLKEYRNYLHRKGVGEDFFKEQPKEEPAQEPQPETKVEGE